MIAYAGSTIFLICVVPICLVLAVVLLGASADEDTKAVVKAMVEDIPERPDDLPECRACLYGNMDAATAGMSHDEDRWPHTTIFVEEDA